ncbi:MAG: hypothetical protein R2849_06195 [Thermomicrobiales bacterium]
MTSRADDLMNHLMTGWRDQRWRALAARLAVSGGASLALDAATGTGGLARGSAPGRRGPRHPESI